MYFRETKEKMLDLYVKLHVWAKPINKPSTRIIGTQTETAQVVLYCVVLYCIVYLQCVLYCMPQIFTATSYNSYISIVGFGRIGQL